MLAALVAVLAALTLSPPFGEASASATPEGSYLAVTVEVQIDPGFAADYLVVHVLNPDGQETFPMGVTAEGRYRATFTVLPYNRAVVFEAGRAGQSSVSRTVSLLDLGVEVDQLKTTFGAPASSAGTRKWGWLALAAAALAGAGLLGYWLWPGSEATSPPIVDTSGHETVVIDDE
jgi:hypothetical protein